MFCSHLASLASPFRTTPPPAARNATQFYEKAERCVRLSCSNAAAATVTSASSERKFPLHALHWRWHGDCGQHSDRMLLDAAKACARQNGSCGQSGQSVAPLLGRIGWHDRGRSRKFRRLRLRIAHGRVTSGRCCGDYQCRPCRGGTHHLLIGSRDSWPSAVWF